MESLLRWGIENSSPSAGPTQPRKDLDPAIIDHILGKPDAVLMKEALSVAVDESRSEDERVEALDNLEMFIEHIDNANDLAKLQMWKPLHQLLTSPPSTSSIKTQTLWVIGTAVQNNPSAQNSYLELAPLPTILSLLQPENTPSTRSKAVYTLSGLLRHNTAAMISLSAADGWTVLKSALADSDIKVRRRTAFLLNTLLLQTHPANAASEIQNFSTSAPVAEANTNTSPVHPNSHASMLSDPSSASTQPLALQAMRGEGVLDCVIEALVERVPFGVDGEVEGDMEFEEQCIRILHTYAMSHKNAFTPAEKKQLQGYLAEKTMAEGEANLPDELKALGEVLQETDE